uniref:ThiF family domain-containing protein, putative n=1 Tax=Neospora caninum (strain Liverpool) TaxID=572307 RepID=A0A0F7UF25_NEOCL|nr:TPA: thiF family domain-containing protein, putative [Neospora caninum Liverpool]
METKAEAEEAVCGVPGRLGREAARAEEGESQREEGGSQRIEGGSQTEEKGRVDGATASGIGCRSSSLREEHRSAPNSSCSGPAASAASSHPRSEASSTRCICASRAVLRFHPFTLSIDVSFWRRLGETKLREWRLQTPWTPLLAVSTPKHFVSRVTPSRAPASFSPGGRTEWRREKAGSASPCSLSPAIFRLDQNAFDLASHPRFLSSSSDASPAAPCFTGEVPLLGFLYNCNSLEQFKAFNRQAAVSQILQAPILSASSLSSQEVRRGSASPDEAQNACGDSPGLLQLPVYEDAFWDFPSRTASLHQHNRPASTGSASLAPQSSPSSASSLSPASSAVASEAVSGRRDAPWLSQCLYTALPPIALACRFFLITFIDLKAFVAFYSVAVPAVRPGTDFAVLSPPRGALLQAHGASRGGKHEKRERTCGPQKGEEEKDDRAREAEGEEQREKREDAQKGDALDEDANRTETRPAAPDSATEDRTNRPRSEAKERERVEAERRTSEEARSDEGGDDGNFTLDEMVSLSGRICTLDSGTASWLQGGVFLLLKKTNIPEKGGEREGNGERGQSCLFLPLTAFELLGPLLPDISAWEIGHASAARFFLSSSHLSALSSHLSKYGSRSCPISAASTPAPPFLRSSGVCTLHLCYLDPSGDPQALGWPLRNLLLLLSVRFSLYNKVLSLLSFRDLLLHRMLSSSSLPLHSHDRRTSSTLDSPLLSDSQNGRTNSMPSLHSLVFHVAIPPQHAFIGALSDPLHLSLSSSSLSSSAGLSPSVSPRLPLRGEGIQDATHGGDIDSIQGRDRCRRDSPVFDEGKETLVPRLNPTVVSGWLRHAGAPPSSAAESARKPSASSSASSTVFVVALRRYLDGKVIQKDAVELNVQLIRWRLLPAFEPRRIQDLRVLLLGAGTLGCGVARLLVAWGVRDFTFVDSSCVALSNPARQCLYTYEDAMPQGTGDQSGGEPGSSGVKKVDAACRRLLAIRPDLRCRGFDLEIPMPGHPRFGHSTPPGGRSLEEAHDLLASLIDEHDVVMMLTDSKESRWLASLIVADRALAEDGRRCAAPLGMAVGLGFDSMVVMRQGYGGNDLGCYFCNAVTAPADSLSNRTLDQQCTVTRPGISSFACSVAVELLAALTQHPKGFAAPHIPSDPLASVHPSSESSRSSASGSSGAGVRRRDEARRGRSGERHVEDFSCMGATPHTVRGYFSSFRMLSLASERNPQCVCCSNAILEKYRENRVQFLREVIASSSVLEKYSGLEELQKQIEARGEDADVVCLSDEEEDENE